MNKHGFTLVELLVTIVIMGIVTAIAFPSIIGLKTANDDKKYKAFSDTLKNGAKLYADENKYDLGTTTKITYDTLNGNNSANKRYVKNDKVSANENCKASCVYIVKTESSPSNVSFRYYPVVICNSTLKYNVSDSYKSC